MTRDEVIEHLLIFRKGEMEVLQILDVVQRYSKSQNSGKPNVLRCRLPRVTENVELLEPPYGKWEVEAVSDGGETLYLVQDSGTFICHYTQVRILER